MRIEENDVLKLISNESYHLMFNKTNGFTMRWGKTSEDDPDYCPFGLEILDLEISSAAANDVDANNPFNIVTNGGCRGIGCHSFCYKKSKRDKSVHMSLDTFKQILDRMPKTLCSIAFGVISPIEQHPQVWEIFEECRNRGIIPCVTINQSLRDGVAERLSRYCGAVAVSVNPFNKQIAYDAINKLSNEFGMNQINIHIVLSNDSVEFIKSVVDDIKSDSRLSSMNALVMLSFKDKAKTCNMQAITSSYYKEVIDYCMNANIPFGFDSCSATCFLDSIKDHNSKDELTKCAEPCESLLFSAYIDVNAKLYACSFLENVGDWTEGISVLDYDNFLDIWNGEKVSMWRTKLIKNKRNCPVYNIGD